MVSPASFSPFPPVSTNFTHISLYRPPRHLSAPEPAAATVLPSGTAASELLPSVSAPAGDLQAAEAALLFPALNATQPLSTASLESQNPAASDPIPSLSNMVAVPGSGDEAVCALFPEIGVAQPSSMFTRVLESSSNPRVPLSKVPTGSLPFQPGLIRAHAGVQFGSDRSELVPLSSDPVVHAVRPPSAEKGPQVNGPKGFSRSFADTLISKEARSVDVPAHNYTVLNPTDIDDKPCLILSEAFHQRQVRAFSHALHGRIILRKGNRPRSASDLHAKL